ncbi:hypothetical protein THRCLA_05567 [Thraustotheca clavata]|uniref:DHHA2 domain-containing protein n=1 Tax=Thraustotheca clavata TaxID=74557 RepID=A0A1V9ZVJ6_9STRA|nr:hypothetical protein THRCLA_05567 [Thraustotheca clavata]
MRLGTVHAEGLNAFLRQARHAALESSKPTGLIVVMGNEACDADSMVSSLVHAFRRPKVDNRIILPVMSVNRCEFALRCEVSALFHAANIDIEALVFQDEIDLKAFHASNALKLILTDHNKLKQEYEALDSAVMEIIDHHDDLGAHTHVVLRDIAFKRTEKGGQALVGSACTLIAERITEYQPLEATLLLGVIALDTMNMDPKAKKGTERDLAVLNCLDKLTLVPREELYAWLVHEKFSPENWKQFTFNNCLIYDFKQFEISATKYGCSSILVPLSTFWSKTTSPVEEVELYRARLNLAFVIVQSLVQTSDGPERQFLLYCPDEALKEALTRFLVEDTAMGLTSVAIDSDVNAFNQANIAMSRKQVVPLLVTLSTAFFQGLPSLLHHAMTIDKKIDAPPPLPPAFQATFTEVFDGFPAPLSTGAWYYHYEANGSHQWRADHYAPQRNNFCSCAKPGEFSTCELYFDPDGLYIHFPSLDDCCRLCTAESGCSPLKPDWLLSSAFTRSPGYDIIHGRKCYQYCTPGAVFNDCMSFDSTGIPCQYSETATFVKELTIIHNLTFTSWSPKLTDHSKHITLAHHLFYKWCPDMLRFVLDVISLYNALNPANTSDDIGSSVYDPLPPPPFPSEVHATFVETYEGYDVPESTGSWFYQYHRHGNKNWRVDHDEPQNNNFCACADPNTTSSCSLYFTNGNMYVNFPDLDDKCCRLCDATTAGCGVLEPDWLSASSPVSTGVDMIDGRICYQFCTPGYQFLDCMSYDDYGMPCRYSETWAPSSDTLIVHNLTFTSWFVHTQAPSIFEIPDTCNQDCPNMFPMCMAPST